MMAGPANFVNLRLKFAFLLLTVLLACPFALSADEFRPALLEITEREGGWIDVTWKVPMMGEKVLGLTPVLPEFLEPLGPGSGRRVAGAWIESSSYSSGGRALNGATVRVDGLDAVPADVVVQVNLLDGAEHSAILRSGNNVFTIPEQVTKMELRCDWERDRSGSTHDGGRRDEGIQGAEPAREDRIDRVTGGCQ